MATSQLNTLLSAIAVGLYFHINIEQSLEILKSYTFPAGRLKPIEGIKHTTIIDDTYNSSPLAVKVALEVLSRAKTNGRRWAVLGDMLELGGHTDTAHAEVGEWVKNFKVDFLVTVGERSVKTNQVAETNGLKSEHAYHFSTTEAAGKFIQSELKKDDVILVKGSQGMRMEKIVKELMSNPLQAENILVRQSKKWLKT